MIYYTANILYNISILIYNRRQKYPGYRGILKCPWAKFSTSLEIFFVIEWGEEYFVNIDCLELMLHALNSHHGM